MLENVEHRQASTNTKYHCLYGYFFLGLSRSQLAVIFRKAKTTVSAWIQAYQADHTLSTVQRAKVFRKFDEHKRNWIVELYRKYPILYLDEARQRFMNHFGVTISASSVCNILHAYGMSWKALERRAVQIRQDDILRYTNELSCFVWSFDQLVFLDEVAFANREMLRSRGYGIKGKSLVYRGEFRRKPRVSSLCFLGETGIIEAFETEGTFTRQKFFDCCRKMALFNGAVRSYPGKHSVWIMDGARIHCDENIILYLRSLGIIPIFLPAYCPFYNPIEIVFGLIKRYLKRHYIEESKTPLPLVVGAALTKFTNYDCSKLFKKCGYFPNGKFIPSVASNS